MPNLTRATAVLYQVSYQDVPPHFCLMGLIFLVFVILPYRILSPENKIKKLLFEDVFSSTVVVLVSGLEICSKCTCSLMSVHPVWWFLHVHFYNTNINHHFSFLASSTQGPVTLLDSTTSQLSHHRAGGVEVPLLRLSTLHISERAKSGPQQLTVYHGCV